MALIQPLIALIVLTILYRRMILRESPAPIGKAQAVLPVLLGLLSTPLSVLVFLCIGLLFAKAGITLKGLPVVIRSILAALLQAGIPEETAKLLMILLSLRIFRSRVGNVYEYILIGAAVGFGFTILEEQLYGSGGIADAAGRLITVAGHMIFGVLMAKHLGIARYLRTGTGAQAEGTAHLNGQACDGAGEMTGEPDGRDAANAVAAGKSAGGEYARAFLIPLVIHTLYDACTADNFMMMHEENGILSLIGVGFAFAGIIVLFVLQFKVLGDCKKHAEEYCTMTL